MKLNKKQKQYLFDNNYVTAKTLDASTDGDWQSFFIKCFDWKLDGKDKYGLEKLYLIDNGKSVLGDFTKGEISYRLGLIFQGNDFEILKNLK